MSSLICLSLLHMGAAGDNNDDPSYYVADDESVRLILILLFLSLCNDEGRANAGRDVDGWHIRTSARHSTWIQPRSPGRLFLPQGIIIGQQSILKDFISLHTS